MRYGWTLDRLEWTALRTGLGSTRWSDVAFASASVRGVPHHPGVYVIIARPPLSDDHEVFSKCRTPIYVGHTVDLRRRMREHLRGELIEGLYRKPLFCFLREADLPVARQTEQLIMQAFGPPKNRVASILVEGRDFVPAGRPRKLS